MSTSVSPRSIPCLSFEGCRAFTGLQRFRLTPSSCAAAVTDFDDFMKLPTCATGSHSLEPAEPLKPVAEASKAPSTTDADGKEVYGAAVPQDSRSEDSSLPPLPPGPKIAHKEGPQKPQSTPYVEEQDDPEVEVKKGMRCKRRACGKEYEGEDRQEGECKYHAGVVNRLPFRYTLLRTLTRCVDASKQPIFHEGALVPQLRLRVPRADLRLLQAARATLAASVACSSLTSSVSFAATVRPFDAPAADSAPPTSRQCGLRDAGRDVTFSSARRRRTMARRSSSTCGQITTKRRDRSSSASLASRRTRRPASSSSSLKRCVLVIAKLRPRS